MMRSRSAFALLTVATLVTVGCGFGATDAEESGRTPASTVVTTEASTTTLVTTTSSPPTTTSPTTPSTSSSTTTTTMAAIDPSPRQRLVIHGTGDVALDPSYVVTLQSEGYEYAWSGLEGLFVDDDLTVINMECAVSDLGAPLPKAFNFRCDPDALPAALEAGVEVANLANNHGMDYGRAALVDSVVNLTEAGIAPVGAGNDYDEAYAPALFERKGWTIAVLGFGGVLSDRGWLATEDRAGIASGDDTPDMVAAVERAAAVADLVIVTVHWGRELQTQPPPDDIARAEAMVAAGADIIFGHHQHRLNPLGWVDGKPVAWGLGNFVWPRITIPSATTAVARVIVEPDGTMGACLIPVEIVRSGHPAFSGNPPGYCAPLYDGVPWTGTEVPDAE